MRLEYWILILVWLISFSLLFAIPRAKRRVAAVAFLFKQFVTYIAGLLAVELGLLAYPVRELSAIYRSSFTYEFWAYPIVCAVFNAHYPADRSRFFQFGYYALWCTMLTVPEVILETYTDLVEYVRLWNWGWTWSTLFATFMMTRLFCSWFFHKLGTHETK